jgi:hypothetical protein
MLVSWTTWARTSNWNRWVLPGKVCAAAALPIPTVIAAVRHAKPPRLLKAGLIRFFIYGAFAAGCGPAAGLAGAADGS